MFKNSYNNTAIPLSSDKKNNFFSYLFQSFSENLTKVYYYATLFLSMLWGVFVLSYSMGFLSFYPDQSVPTYLILALLITVVFPIAMIWFGYFTYCNITKNQEVGNALMEAARVLSSPALLAADDVKKLSSVISDELNEMRHALREIEDRMLKVHSMVPKDKDSFLEKTVTPDPVAETKPIENKIETPIPKRYMNVNHVEDASFQEQQFHYQAEEVSKDIEQQINSIVQEQNKSESMQDLENISTAQMTPSFQILKEEETPVLQESPDAYLLKNERQLYEGLYALTVDMNRIMGTEAPQELWPEYIKGNKEVFAQFFCEWVKNNYALYKQKAHCEECQNLFQRFINQYDMLHQKIMDLPYQEVKEYLKNSTIGIIYQIFSTQKQSSLS